MILKRSHFVTIFLVFYISMFAGNCSHADDDDVQYNLSPGIITDPYWQEISDTNSPPSPRNAVMSAYDPEHDKLILFGGCYYDPPDDTQYLNDTWEFSNDEWHRIITDVQPPGRDRGGMCYCSAWHKFILFGGQNEIHDFNDTWSYDQNNGWTKLNTSHKPAARSYFAMTFDERLEKVLIFGGTNYSANLFWAFDGNDWELLDSGMVSPRRSVRMAYDSNRQVTVLFGGFVNIGDVFNDTWEFDGQQWQEISLPHNPDPRYAFNLCYYPKQKKCVLFGGSVVGVDYNDTWVYDGNDWEKLALDLSPSARKHMSLDACDTQVIMFGGIQHSITNLGDTWAYSIIEETTSTPAMSPLVIAVLIFLFTVIFLFFGNKHKQGIKIW